MSSINCQSLKPYFLPCKQRAFINVFSGFTLSKVSAFKFYTDYCFLLTSLYVGLWELKVPDLIIIFSLENKSHLFIPS